ncbi:ABC transporter ATP-binding protein [Staphylococcus pseudintermedius]|uniref:ABC transporter ATP-binding protein n=1 Tax=Staphylococcus pseudintermedius TaxID=283734 RepID=UPI00218B6B2F|nr:ABC transporter ATP-binding protein [Staphylococcus pseudintermedius]EIQ3872085.1 ABC transporter ATP-binding protein [Staphylococcus pseudintermedius]EJA1900645.1 ABC transporter ATP-binding protein [Staphylococcus pseudintermedius]MDK3605889.1 ABC transporter ATP-binding protein [Staphylococcus pseudintermedius]MDK3845914.1 ABC transporter ATP-binding protein [Staphylococcus pseudintermedius]MDT0927340.1 ABC transporter ATP-binding protein [Staphylococcus pseudintermedius]
MIEIKNLTKRYKDKVVLDGINITLCPGEVVGLLGDNGSGKTTLIKCLMNLLSYKGKIFIDEILIQKNQAVENVSFLLEPSFLNDLSAKKNLNFIKGYLEETNDIDKILRDVNLYDYRDVKIKNYSYGMKQRLGLAQALINRNNKYIILDEPTVGIDPVGIDILKEKVRSVSNDIGVLITSHELSFINETCDRVLFLNNGTIKEIKDFKENKHIYHIEIENENNDDVYKFLKHIRIVENRLTVPEKELNNVLVQLISRNLRIRKIYFEDFLQTLYKDD